MLSCVYGSFCARIKLSGFVVCRLRSCVRPFDAVGIAAGLDEVRTLGPNQINGLVRPDSSEDWPVEFLRRLCGLHHEASVLGGFAQ